MRGTDRSVSLERHLELGFDDARSAGQCRVRIARDV